MTYRRIVVLGGGTAGWMTAAALATGLKGTTVELVESEDIGTVGVGEATFPSIRNYHQILGIPESDFLRATNGTYKLGIRFCDWRVRGEDYYHTFGNFGQMTGPESLYGQYRRHPDADVPVFGELCLPTVMAKQNRFCLPGQDSAAFNYAYHFDATLYARYLRKRSEARGVRRVEGKIGKVVQHPESGFIEAVVMESGQRIDGDLFIDCTGFRGLLIEQTLKAGYEDWSQWLRNDSALALQTDCPLDNIPPYTRAIAHQSGWQWKIPLQHRQGTGHVYSSAYSTDEEARRVLMDKLEGNIRVELRLLKFKTGRRKSAWVKNCVAIGLAGGFVEPLESTSIHLIQAGITRLLRLFPISGCSESLQKQYNQESSIEYERIRDFIVLHYKATERDDTPYWRDCRDMAIPDSLAHRLELFRETGMIFPDAQDVFRVDSWMQVLVGQRKAANAYHYLGRMHDTERLRTMLSTLRESISTQVEKMPTHKQFLDSYCLIPDDRLNKTGAQ